VEIVELPHPPNQMPERPVGASTRAGEETSIRFPNIWPRWMRRVIGRFLLAGCPPPPSPPHEGEGRLLAQPSRAPPSMMRLPPPAWGRDGVGGRLPRIPRQPHRRSPASRPRYSPKLQDSRTATPETPETPTTHPLQRPDPHHARFHQPRSRPAAPTQQNPQ